MLNYSTTVGKFNLADDYLWFVARCNSLSLFVSATKFLRNR